MVLFMANPLYTVIFLLHPVHFTASCYGQKEQEDFVDRLFCSLGKLKKNREMKRKRGKWGRERGVKPLPVESD